MRKIIASFVLLAATLTGVAVAQSNPHFVWASAYNNWALPGIAKDTYTFNATTSCIADPYSSKSFGFATTAPVYLKDFGTATNSEIVAVSSVVNTVGTCGFVPTSPAHDHTSFQAQSGTAGLQEALNSLYAASSYPANVLVDQNFYNQAVSIGTTASALIGAAVGGAGIDIVDTTKTPWQFYSWNSTTSKYQGAQNASSITVTQAAPGQVRAIIGSITTSNASFADTNSSMVGVRGLGTIPAGTTASSGYAYGVQGKEIVAGTLAGSTWTFGLLGQLDVSAATLTSGSHVAPIWGDFGATAPSGTCTFCNLMVLTNTTAATTGSAIYVYSKSSVAFDLNSNGSAMLDASSTASGAVIGHIAVTLNGVTGGVIRVYNGT